MPHGRFGERSRPAIWPCWLRRWRLEFVNVAGRRWRLAAGALVELASALDQLGFGFIEPGLDRVARRIGHGLPARDAAYVALTEAHGVPLVTGDGQIAAIAGEVARPLHLGHR